MKKLLISLAIIIIAILGGLYYLGASDMQQDVDHMKQETAAISLLYAQNIFDTQAMVPVARMVDKDEFDDYMETLLAHWKLLEERSNNLAHHAEDVVTMYDDKKNLALIQTLYAYQGYTKEEITKIFDEAPAGKRIKTLAQELEVSAKRAYKVLQMTQEELKAEAWNEAGDQFETLENATKAVKDTCKVGLYVGGAALTGGSSGILGEAALTASGADLLLEIGTDSANAYFGYNNDLAAVLSGTRDIFTKKAAGVLGFMTLDFSDAENTFNSGVFLVDNAISYYQDNEIAGFSLNPKEQKLTVETIPRLDFNQWLDDNNLDSEPTPDVVLKTITDSSRTIIPPATDSIEGYDNEYLNLNEESVTPEPAIGNEHVLEAFDFEYEEAEKVDKTEKEESPESKEEVEQSGIIGYWSMHSDSRNWTYHFKPDGTYSEPGGGGTYTMGADGYGNFGERNFCLLLEGDVLKMSTETDCRKVDLPPFEFVRWEGSPE
ncbi:hypothetical protein GF369_04705 [Candidatus Peregrinibacteria bacterium]|nr:hypothetical protein [Candidatus Peregrinibacteria bacterium]